MFLQSCIFLSALNAKENPKVCLNIFSDEEYKNIIISKMNDRLNEIEQNEPENEFLKAKVRTYYNQLVRFFHAKRSIYNMLSSIINHDVGKILLDNNIKIIETMNRNIIDQFIAKSSVECLTKEILYQCYDKILSKFMIRLMTRVYPNICKKYTTIDIYTYSLKHFSFNSFASPFSANSFWWSAGYMRNKVNIKTSSDDEYTSTNNTIGTKLLFTPTFLLPCLGVYGLDFNGIKHINSYFAMIKFSNNESSKVVFNNMELVNKIPDTLHKSGYFDNFEIEVKYYDDTNNFKHACFIDKDNSKVIFI